MFDKWFKNIKNTEPNGSAGVCPYCGSSHTHYSLTVIDDEDKHGWGALWCDDCKKAFHADGRHFDFPPQEGIPVPDGLMYS
jgi:uncharacterized protein YbaR (Trm112 family)